MTSGNPPVRTIVPTLAVLISLAVAAGAQPKPPEGAPELRVVGRSFLAIQVADAAEAADWYQAIFGLAEVNRIESEDGRYSIRILSGDGLTVELIRLRGAAPRPDGPQLGLFKAGFHVVDIDAAFAWLREHQVDTDDSIFVDEALDARSFVFRDPYGNRLQVFQQRGAD